MNQPSDTDLAIVYGCFMAKLALSAQYAPQTFEFLMHELHLWAMAQRQGEHTDEEVEERQTRAYHRLKGLL